MILSTMVIALCVLGVMVSFPSIAMAAPAGDIEIWDGESIEIQQAPYQIALLLDGRFSCGGSLISEDVVLTAAHCIPKEVTLASKLSIRAGSNLRKGGGIVIKVKGVSQHPKFVLEDGKKKDYDIALLRLEQPLAFSENISAVKIAAKDYEVNDGEMMVVSGWGRMRDGSYPDVLQMVELPKFNFEKCKKIYAGYSEQPPLTPRFLCAGTLDGGNNTCHGDSGGPLVHKGIQVGVVSGGSPQCAIPNYPANYTKVSAVRDWIDAFMKP